MGSTTEDRVEVAAAEAVQVTIAPYRIDFTHAKGYLRALVTGDVSGPEVRIRSWREIMDECRRIDCSRLLVVRDCDFRGTVTDAFRTATETVAVAPPGIMVAFVDLHRENDEMNDFGLTVAQNRGANAKVFSDEAGAIEWLTADS